MKIERLEIEGAWIARSHVHSDERGFFREWFKSGDTALATGREFYVAQSNVSVSHKGVLRVIHYSLATGGQAKWITCVSGSIWDVIVDIRPSSPTYKKWVGVSLSGSSGDAVLISEGLGHGFISLEDHSTVAYLVTSPYSPTDEYEINPFDPDLNIEWPVQSPRMSAKDMNAPDLVFRFTEGKLPL